MSGELFAAIPPEATIVEVGPRDGLQNEAVPVSVADKVALIEALAEAGLPVVEAGAFVSPRWVPQMAGSDEVLRAYQDAGTVGVLGRARPLFSRARRLRSPRRPRRAAVRCPDRYGGATTTLPFSCSPWVLTCAPRTIPA